MRRRDVMLSAGAAAVGVASAAATSSAAAEAKPQVRLVKLRFKPGGRRIWQDWAAELERRRVEVLETLRNEGVSSEACFLSDDGEHVFYFMEVADMARLRPPSPRAAIPSTPSMR